MLLYVTFTFADSKTLAAPSFYNTSIIITVVPSINNFYFYSINI